MPPTVCRNCGRAHFSNPKPCGEALAECAGNVLLVKRACEPWRGHWDIPGGFCDPGEHLFSLLSTQGDGGRAGVGENDAMIGRLRSVVLDCPDPRALAGFYTELLGLPVTGDYDDWVTIGGEDGQPRVAFQQAPDHRSPRWPDPDHPQQFHLDVEVDDVDEAERQVLALGATRLPGEGDDWRVYADPAGHPFCLVFA